MTQAKIWCTCLDYSARKAHWLGSTFGGKSMMNGSVIRPKGTGVKGAKWWLKVLRWLHAIRYQYEKEQCTTIAFRAHHIWIVDLKLVNWWAVRKWIWWNGFRDFWNDRRHSNWRLLGCPTPTALWPVVQRKWSTFEFLARSAGSSNRRRPPAGTQYLRSRACIEFPLPVALSQASCLKLP